MLNRVHVWAVVAAMMIGGAAALAEIKGDPAAGEGKAGRCGGCLGFDGYCEDATFTRLAGQYEANIAKQFSDFQ